jgi:crossover junction endodeoxyribonuclease RuvC
LRHYIGIDPGVSGGAALLDEESRIISTTKLDESEHDIQRWFEQEEVWAHSTKTMAVIEKVHSMPKQGVASTFTFGRSYGFMRGLLIANKISFTDVTPAVWQRSQGCLSKGDKRVTYRRAQEIFPEIRVTHAIADALLIADYCRKLYAYMRDENEE